jgi:hypothetical protein
VDAVVAYFMELSRDLRGRFEYINASLMTFGPHVAKQ